MKRNRFQFSAILALILLCACAFAGCSPGKVVEQIIGSGDPRPEAPPTGAPPHRKPRVYMDEVTGELTSFDGGTLTLKVGEEDYIFDVSHANMECKRGILLHDEVSVIYEGKLDGTNTETVSALKVTDSMHKEGKLKERKLVGTLTQISSFAATVQTAEGRVITCPIIGKPASFLGGLHLGERVTLHYFGRLPSEENSSGPEEFLFDVLSISDTEPFALPDFPQTTQDPAAQNTEPAITPIRCSMEQLNGQMIRLHPVGYTSVLEINLADYAFYLPEGFLPESSVSIYAKGTFNGQDLGGLDIQYLQGTDPQGIRTGEVSSYVTGVITGTTANTLTIMTPDQVYFTCYTAHVQDLSSHQLQIGSSLKITLQPIDTQNTNIYTVMKFEDA